jgi:hypothetical protein
MRTTIALLVAAIAATPALGDAEFRRLQVGSTGIMCVTEPCPWRGITEPPDMRPDPLRPLWSGDALPPVTGSEDDRACVSEAWDEYQCIEIEGSFDGETLHVAEVIGAC